MTVEEDGGAGCWESSDRDRTTRRAGRALVKHSQNSNSRRRPGTSITAPASVPPRTRGSAWRSAASSDQPHCSSPLGSGTGVDLGLEDSRGRLQDGIGAAQFSVRPAQLPDLFAVGNRDAGTGRIRRWPLATRHVDGRRSAGAARTKGPTTAGVEMPRSQRALVRRRPRLAPDLRFRKSRADSTRSRHCSAVVLLLLLNTLWAEMASPFDAPVRGARSRIGHENGGTHP